MRLVMLTVAMSAALVFGGSQAEAGYGYGWHPWCAFLAGDLPGGGCMFNSQRECWATVRGVGGYCGINPASPPPTAQHYRKRHRRYYR